MNELFDLPPSPPPRLVELRAQCAAALEAFQSAELTEADTGEPIPREIRYNLASVEERLRLLEEAQSNPLFRELTFAQVVEGCGLKAIPYTPSLPPP